MKSRAPTLKAVAVTFVIALLFYLAAYSWLHKRQTGKGPWQVNFTTNSTGVLQLIIAQPALGISNVTIIFAGEQLASTNGIGTVAFARPRETTPFGRVAYDDLMFQPGD